MNLTNRQLRRTIQAGLIALVALMPFHAFLSVWLGSLTGQQAVIQAWKEVLLLTLGALALWLLWRDRDARRRLSNWPVRLIGLFGAIALLVTALAHPPLAAAAFGAKTDLEFLFACTLALLVASPRFVRLLGLTVLFAAVGVIGFGLLQAYVLPPDFLTRFGYGPTTIPPYLKLDPAIDTLRYGSTLGGPNQLGTYLILPIVLAVTLALRRGQWWWGLLAVAGGVVLYHTYSRSAWIGALLALVVTAWLLTPTRYRAIGLGLLGAAAVGVIAFVAHALGKGGKLQYILLHTDIAGHDQRGSDFEHVQSLRLGAEGIMTNPIGHGLGSAGPAFFHTGVGRIIENNYLQIAYETGVAGGIAFIMLILATARELAARATHHDLALASFAALAGLSLVAVVLPAWTDSSTALIFWTASGAVMGLSREGQHV